MDYAKMDSLMIRDNHGGWKISRGELKEIITQLGGRLCLDEATTQIYLEER